MYVFIDACGYACVSVCLCMHVGGVLKLCVSDKARR